ncbi:MAG: hypothetical protein WCC95_06800 [Candidatus Sulfotelmatobacter sp.]|jgi:hypothetical protein
MAVLPVLSLPLLQAAHAQTETVLYNFCSVGGVSLCYDGEYPMGALASDAYGNFYGTRSSGGTSCATSSCSGTVFEVFPEPTGGCETGTNTGKGWCDIVLYNFCSVTNCADGGEPMGNVSYLNAFNPTGKPLRHDLFRREPRFRRRLRNRF